jgi:Kdo2-lipid IVA lauroyltransferase/acyltransferase
VPDGSSAVPASAEGTPPSVLAVAEQPAVQGLLRALSWIVARLPDRAATALGRAVGWFAWRVLRYRRAHVEHAMGRAGIADVPAAARAMYRALGVSMVEVLSLGSSRRATARVRIDPASLALWNAARARGRGVVVAGTHTGNWDLAACAMAQRDEILVVSKHLGVRWLDRFWQAARALRGVRLAYARGAFAAARRVLASGGTVVLMIDQVPIAERHGTLVDFLGCPALTDRSPAALAAVREAPLVVAAARRDGSGEQVLHVLEVLVPPSRAGRSWVEDATRRATRALDRFVRAHPDQWLWLHRRWGAPRPARASG